MELCAPGPKRRQLYVHFHGTVSKWNRGRNGTMTIPVDRAVSACAATAAAKARRNGENSVGSCALRRGRAPAGDYFILLLACLCYFCSIWKNKYKTMQDFRGRRECLWWPLSKFAQQSHVSSTQMSSFPNCTRRCCAHFQEEPVLPWGSNCAVWMPTANEEQAGPWVRGSLVAQPLFLHLYHLPFKIQCGIMKVFTKMK